jgi:cytochrome c556
MRHPILASVLVATAAFAASALAVTAVKPSRAIHYRQGIYHAIGWNFGPMNAMVRGQQPFDQADFAKRAKRIEFYSQQLLEGFPQGTGPEAGVKTDAKADIWTHFDDFQTKLKNFQDAAAHLATVAQGNDEAASKQAFADTAKACKACHEKYREDDD